MKKIYAWRNNKPLYRLSAQEVGEILEDIEKRYGVLKADYIVTEAADEDHPLHDYFEWNDQKAAHNWRLEQSRKLFQAIMLVAVDEKPVPPVRAFVNVKPTVVQDGSSEPYYMSTTRIKGNRNLEVSALERFLKLIEELNRQVEALERFFGGDTLASIRAHLEALSQETQDLREHLSV